MIPEDCYQRPCARKVFVRTVFEPRNRFALLAIEGRLRSSKLRRLLQMFVEPLANQVVLFFFVWVKPSILPQVADGVEYPKLPLGIFVDVSNNESQIHCTFNQLPKLLR